MASYADAAITLGERRVNRSSDMTDWSPRDLLIKMLRDHDSGAVPLESLVVCWQGGGSGGHWVAALNLPEAVGMLAIAQVQIIVPHNHG